MAQKSYQEEKLHLRKIPIASGETLPVPSTQASAWTHFHAAQHRNSHTWISCCKDQRMQLLRSELQPRVFLDIKLIGLIIP